MMRRKLRNCLQKFLEKKRGHLEEIEAKNLEYDEEFANIGKGETEEENDENK